MQAAETGRAKAHRSSSTTLRMACLKNKEAVAIGNHGKDRGQQRCDTKRGLAVRGCVPNCKSLEAVLGAGFYLE